MKMTWHRSQRNFPSWQTEAAKALQQILSTIWILGAIRVVWKKVQESDIEKKLDLIQFNEMKHLN